MARGRVRQTTALGLALRLLLGFGLGGEAVPTSVPTWSFTQAPDPSAGLCPSTEFQCRTEGHCIPLMWRCDGDQDCPDGSDEEECSIEPPTGSACSCDSLADCPGGINKNVNCGPPLCPEGELHCALGDACIPHTWLCDGHPDCSDSSDELGCGTKPLQEGSATSMGTSVTLESIPYLRNSTVTPIKDQDSVQSGNRSSYGVIAAAVVLSVGLAAAILFVLLRLYAQGCLSSLGLLVAVKGSLHSERMTSVL
ncbi:CD320 antigen [Camelus dromedarius]|uniref:CD320 antigen n=3 Tax=Camelus TaxID=9836 RepID=A0A5N4CK08_CAMDR|nr:CD320 antigen isoform X1 [Camelus bactrianus]XP_031293000.1 CD320 antigen isoform X1 [Camelus dromedarius]XP_032322211.1 CD320 antigen isoform X1 [Camelus ferus]KAB1259261.1 CD320 antigen [Camelus dromedarius]